MRKGFIKGFASGLSVDPRSTNSLNSIARRTLLPTSWMLSIPDCQECFAF